MLGGLAKTACIISDEIFLKVSVADVPTSHTRSQGETRKEAHDDIT